MLKDNKMGQPLDRFQDSSDGIYFSPELRCLQLAAQMVTGKCSHEPTASRNLAINQVLDRLSSYRSISRHDCHGLPVLAWINRQRRSGLLFIFGPLDVRGEIIW